MDRTPKLAVYLCLTLAALCCFATASAAPVTNKQKPTGLKRPKPSAPPTGRLTTRAQEQTVMTAQGFSIQAVGTNYTDTPPLSASFEALLSDGSAYNPDTYGAVGPNHLMVTLNTEVRIQNRSGAELTRTNLDGWWKPIGGSNVFDPRIVYDPYGGRFIFSANNDPGGPNPGVLLAVSASNDPTGVWHRRFIRVNTNGPVFADSPIVGFNRYWIVLAADTYTNTAPYDFASAQIYVFNKTNLYANGTIAPRLFSYTDTAALVPVVTYDPSFPTNYIVAEYNSNADGTNGYLATFSIGGPVTAPVFTELTFPEGPAWAHSADPDDLTDDPENLAPQLGTTNRIALGDSRIRSATWRVGTIQAAQTIFLPAINPTRAAVQWWEFHEDLLLRQGQIDSGHTGRMYAFPSIAANRNNDILVGFSRFSTNEFPSAAYAFRQDGDPDLDALRPQVFLKPGLASYFRTNDFGENVWGDTSATMIDPVNDTDFWTIQQYAEFPDGATSRWGTWWGRVSPPNDLLLTATESPDPVVAGSNLTYTITVTNLFSGSAGPNASGVRISNALPATLTYVMASASQGSCAHSAGVVICDLGTLTNAARATATIVVKPNIVGTVTNTIGVHANGPDADFGDNSVTLTTTTLPSADLAVLLAESQDPVTVGSNLTYTIVVTNEGPAEATLVRVTNNLPASCTFLSVMPSIGTCSNSGTVVNCNLGSILPNTNATVTITARPNTGGITISNRARVFASSVDTDTSNNAGFILTYVNARPTISAITNRTILEDATTVIPFTIGDVETPAASLTLATSSSNPAVIPNANVTLGGSGTSRNVTITPAPNQSGSSMITISVADSEGATTTRTFTITVTAVNDVPTITAIPNPAAIDEDTSTADISFTVGDVETPAGSLIVTGNSSNPTLVPVANIVFGGAGTANRTVRVTPATNQFGSATITVTVSDGAASSNRTFVVMVNPVNDPPVISAIADRVINEDTPTPAIAFNFIDVESAGALTVTATSSNPSLAPTNRMVFGGTGTNRTVIITPATNEHGIAAITITVSDGSLTDSSTFNLTVNSVNDVPTLNALSNISTNEDAGQIVVPLTGISSGAANEDQPLTIEVINSNPAVVQSVLNYTPNASNGTLSLNTVTNASGASTITVTLRDDGESNNVVVETFTVTLTAVNDRPVISAFATQSTDEDVPIGPIDFTINDVETAAASLTLTAASSNPAIVPVGNITFGGAANNRTLTVRPATNQFTTSQMTITVTVSDGALTASNSFLLTINSVNDAPRFVTAVGDRSIAEDTSATIPFTIGDVETAAASLTITATTSSDPALAPLSSISFGGSGSNRTVIIMPVTNEVGSSTIELRLSDGVSNTFDSFVFTVTNVNDAPRILTSISDQTIQEDASTPAIAFTVDDEETAAGSLMVTGASSNPTLVPGTNIVFTGAGTANRTVRVTPAANQFGSATITINVSDGVVTGSDSFLVTVTSVNDFPTITSIPNVVTNEDFPTVALPFMIRDVETLAANLVLTGTSSNPEVVDDSGIVFGGAATNRTVVIRPLTNQVGSATITISVADASNAVAITEFEVEFIEVNDAPSINNITNLTVNEDTNSVLVAFTIDDPETLPQNLIVSASSSNPTLVPNSNLTLGGTGANRTLRMVPASNQFGMTTISISVSDGTLTNTDTFVLTVTAVNDAPTLTRIADQVIAEDTNTGALAFTVDDVDAAETNLTLSAASSNPAIVPVANVTFGGSGANRTVTVRPATNQFGACVITVTVSDGALTASTNFTVTVTPVNDAPTINAIANVTITEDAPQQTVNFNGVGPGPNESQSLTVMAVSSNPSLIADPLVTYSSPQTNGTLRFTPSANANGSATITVTVDDGQSINRSTTRMFTVTVNAVNDTPTLSDIGNITTGEDTSVSTTVTIGDVETPVSALILATASSNPALLPNSNINFHGSGSLRTLVLTPALNQFGSSTVTVTLGDGVAATNDTFVLTVTGTNDPPTLNPIRDVHVDQGSAYTTITLTGISSGAGNESQTLTLSNSISTNIFQNAPSLTYTNPNTTAALKFRPGNGSPGASVVTVFVRENTNVNNMISRSFTIFVKPSGNTAPTISTITNRTTPEDTPISIPFVVNDSQTPASLLTVKALSTNLTLLPSNSFAFSGTGTNRTLTITPAADRFGSATVNVSVTDTNFGGASTNFVLTVASVNDLPVISAISSPLTIQKDSSTGPLPFTVGDAETPAGLLTLSATSSNPTLVPVGNVVFGGVGTNRSVTVTPAANQTGSATINVVVTDANTGTAATSFTVNVVQPVPLPLAIVRSGSLVTISWPESGGSAFVLQSRASFQDIWSDVSGTPILSGGRYTVSQTITGSGRFYRLRSQ